MTIFKNSFKQHIKDELGSRKEFGNRQNVYVPNVRVTALIQGKYKGQTLHGFTLGIPDSSLVNKLSSITNVSGQGTTVGITYITNSPEPVIIPTKQNLPSPGVTNIVISTQSKGGLIFKATVDFKFYGKEQYDFIYQTFMRPGNPIVIEYGHTKAKGSLNDLNFFDELTQDNIEQFKKDLYQLKPIEKTRNGGKVVGLVSNFKISLNESNEYEAQIELINALEFMYTLPPQDTVLSYDDSRLSRSILTAFGHKPGEQYDQEKDRVFKFILEDLVEESGLYAKEILNPGERTPPEIDSSFNIVGGAGERTAQASSGLVTSTLYPNALNSPDAYYVSLKYVVGRMLTTILEKMYLVSFRTRNTDTSFPIPDIVFDEIGKWDLLRSTNIQSVIINNEFLYTEGAPQDQTNQTSQDSSLSIPYKFISRLQDYKESFNLEYSELPGLFTINTNWRPPLKRAYGSTGDGLYINYDEVRKHFINATSISEAIIRLLNLINVASNGVLDLKLRMKLEVLAEDSPSGEESFVLVIYDQPSLSTEEDTIYTFFENDVSEAISYNFDFSLPSSVASTIVANNFKSNQLSNQLIVGIAETEQLIKNGYVDSISSLLSSPTTINEIDVYDTSDTNIVLSPGYKPPDPRNRNVVLFPGLPKVSFWWNKFRSKISELTPTDSQKRLKEQLRNEGEMFQQMIGYKELVPPGMKSSIIRSGLFNVLPTTAKVTIKLLGIDGFRFGDIFRVNNMLPHPYDDNNIFYLTGYKHTINSDSWITEIDGLMIASTPDDKNPRDS